MGSDTRVPRGQTDRNPVFTLPSPILWMWSVDIFFLYDKLISVSWLLHRLCWCWGLTTDWTEHLSLTLPDNTDIFLWKPFLHVCVCVRGGGGGYTILARGEGYPILVLPGVPPTPQPRTGNPLVDRQQTGPEEGMLISATVAIGGSGVGRHRETCPPPFWVKFFWIFREKWPSSRLAPPLVGTEKFSCLITLLPWDGGR